MNLPFRLKKRNNIIFTLVIISSTLVLLDMFITTMGIGIVGLEFEGNPFVKRMFENGTEYIWILLKFLAVGLLFFGSNLLIKKKKFEENIVYFVSVFSLILLSLLHVVLSLPWIGVIIK